MRILALNDTALEGGAAQLFRRTNQLLREAGHQVVEVTGDDLQSRYSVLTRRYAASSLRKHPHVYRMLRPIWQEVRRVFGSVQQIYHPKLIARLDALVRENEFDVAHVHNIHGALSTQVLPFLKSRGLPIVYQVNDYYFFCNTGWAYNRRLDMPCSKCIKGNAWWAVRYGCISYLGKGSIVSIAAEAAKRFAVNATNRWSAIDLFIVTGLKTSQLLQKWGVGPERQHLMRNPMTLSEFKTPVSIGDEIVFYGTDLPVKGVGIFQSALEYVNPGTRIGVYLNGMRPEYERSLQEVASRRNLVLHCDSSLRWHTGLQELLAKEARAVVVPSKWWVTSENVVYEGLLLGKPVITSDSGGNAELIEQGVTGFVFKSGDHRELANYINLLSEDRQLAEKMGNNAYAQSRQQFAEAITLESLEKAYRKAQDLANTEGARTK